MESTIRERLDERLRAADLAAIASEIATSTGQDLVSVTSQLEKYLAESRAALGLVEPHLRPGDRILEFGSGIGFFAGFLDQEGYDIVELEPVGLGFDFVGAARQALALPGGPRHLDIGIELVDPDEHGQFDLVYSLNVLEHVEDWRGALDSALRVLKPGGKIVVSCPNYTIPYEPHFGVPLLPFRPGATARLLPDRVAESDLWRSLNWVTLRQVRQWAGERHVRVAFVSGLLADALQRLNDDEEFRKRHGAVLRTVARVLRIGPVRRSIRALPPAITTPMRFVVEKS